MLTSKYTSLGNADTRKESRTPTTAATCNGTENRREFTNHIEIIFTNHMELLLMFIALGTKVELKAIVLLLASCLTLEDLRKPQIVMHEDKEQALAVESHVVCQKQCALA